MKHIVFVESNACGLLALKTAKEMGYCVSFVRTPHFDFFYKSDPLYPLIREMVDREVITEEVTDEQCLYNVLKSIHEKKPIDGLITALDHIILPVSKVAHRLGIPFTSAKGIENTRNKWRMRELLDQHGLANIQYIKGSSQKALCREAKTLNFPLIIKPSRGVDSLLIEKVENKSQLSDALDRYQQRYVNLEQVYRDLLGDEIVIENYLDGSLFSLEIGALHGRYFPFAITERKRYYRNDAIELGGTMTTDFSPELKKQIYSYGISFCEAIDLDLGIFHLEMILTEKGPVIIDPNPRMIGGLAPKMLSEVLGLNIYQVLINIHLQNEDNVFDKDFETKCYATDRDLACAEDGIVENEVDLDWVTPYYEQGLVDFRFELKQGDSFKKVTSNHENIGTLVVSGRTSEESKNMADKIVSLLAQKTGLPILLK